MAKTVDQRGIDWTSNSLPEEIQSVPGAAQGVIEPILRVHGYWNAYC